MEKKFWIVTADTHLGAIHWQNLIREDDYYLAFEFICRSAAQNPLCLGVIGLGDLRERAGFQAKNLGGMTRGLKILMDAKKPLLALMGNHDFTEPNWIREMNYPSLKDLTDPEVQEAYGFNPTTTLALHYTPPEALKSLLKSQGRSNSQKTIIFFHQALKNLTTNLRQNADISLEELEAFGFGTRNPCLILLGDLHNYGDTTHNQLTAVYPGSPEMTDINEGVNGLKTQRLSTNPHDYRKFILYLYPEENNTFSWEPIELSPRPWFRGKAKTEKETKHLINILKLHSQTWSKPPCVAITVPKSQREKIQAFLSSLDILETRIDELAEEATIWLADSSTETEISWEANKKALLQLAQQSDLDMDATRLLKEICKRDGSNHSVKADISNAWQAWINS